MPLAAVVPGAAVTPFVLASVTVAPWTVAPPWSLTVTWSEPAWMLRLTFVVPPVATVTLVCWTVWPSVVATV